MDLPERVFVLARIPARGPGDDPMRLYTLVGHDQQVVTPVFSSIARAATFLEGAQAAGKTLGFDYVFPATAGQFGSEFAGYHPVLDPEAGDFFEPTPSRPPD